MTVLMGEMSESWTQWITGIILKKFFEGANCFVELFSFKLTGSSIICRTIVWVCRIGT